ncbi:hypothetical protein V6N12_049080 [Hibiscus sabdariffa]|uniref:Uncharacterized protein n=1 Tax=Hibiscus sabdariffa TaxID=183260 RepID=A0ABR2EJI2_9ROSI
MACWTDRAYIWTGSDAWVLGLLETDPSSVGRVVCRSGPELGSPGSIAPKGQTPFFLFYFPFIPSRIREGFWERRCEGRRVTMARASQNPSLILEGIKGK